MERYAHLLLFLFSVVIHLNFKLRFPVVIHLTLYLNSYFLVSEESCRNSKALPVTFLNSERKTSEGIDHLGKSD